MPLKIMNSPWLPSPAGRSCRGAMGMPRPAALGQ